MAVLKKKQGKVHKSITTKLWQLNEFVRNSIGYKEDSMKMVGKEFLYHKTKHLHTFIKLIKYYWLVGPT
jgi:hypothetical protein